MSIEETKQVVEAFVDTGAGCWLAESVQLSSPTRVVASGRDAVRDKLAQLHTSDADDGRVTQTRLVVGDGIAAVEIRPRPGGRHGTARSAACFYEVSDGEIVRASIHIDSTTATGPNEPQHTDDGRRRR